MKFVLLFGPQAVGKMTIGHHLEEITELKLFHNHMTIELICPFFDFGTPSFNRLVNLFRNEMFKEMAQSQLSGVIFTYVWAFDQQEDWNFINNTCKIFEESGAEIFFVELEAEMEERRIRNQTPHRLAHKPTKRNVEFSDHEVVHSLDQFRLHSYEGEIQQKNYIKINNTHLQPEEVAQIIKETFAL
ncbi:AAA family ATPase [Bacillus carboniphilus]|uniref:AAA family ATPase n=1 Tax=Bacillus carboniphilus TaxID=86663 RepID=A0ABY9JWV6_9BACI|nr:AAA family ATPase [Bacillus carboniphilus]WLR42988.1 AAA family ATPase [Bacillus carboniphilus]